MVLVVLGLGLWAVYRFAAGNEPHSFARGGIAPTYVQVIGGNTYDLAIPDGVTAESQLGLEPAALRCTQSTPGAAAMPLSLRAEQASTKATNQIATFVAITTARIHIDCPGLPPVFVDDAVGAGTDRSGLWLVLASIALATGVPLTLSVLRRPSEVTGPGTP